MKKVITPYFPIGLKYATPVIVGAGVYIWSLGYPSWLAAAILLSIIVLTTNYVTEINLKAKRCRDYISFLWIPCQEESFKFRTIEKIVIRKENHAQMIITRYRSRQLDWESFTGTLVFDEDNTLDLLTRNNKGELIKGLKVFSEFLNTHIEDQSTPRHYIVDPSRV